MPVKKSKILIAGRVIKVLTFISSDNKFYGKHESVSGSAKLIVDETDPVLW